jgi:hypothetical protein
VSFVLRILWRVEGNQALLTGCARMAYRLAMTAQRPHRLRTLLLGAALLLLLVAAAAGLALAARPTTVAVAPLDPNIPNEQALINAGLSGTPGPGQPAAPVVVDRVLVDGAAPGASRSSSLSAHRRVHPTKLYGKIGTLGRTSEA